MTKEFKSTEQVQADESRRISKNMRLRTMVLNSEYQQDTGPSSQLVSLVNSHGAYLMKEKAKISGKHSTIVKRGSACVGNRVPPLLNDESFQNPAPSEGGGVSVIVGDVLHDTDSSISMIEEEPAKQSVRLNHKPTEVSGSLCD